MPRRVRCGHSLPAPLGRGRTRGMPTPRRPTGQPLAVARCPPAASAPAPVGSQKGREHLSPGRGNAGIVCPDPESDAADAKPAGRLVRMPHGMALVVQARSNCHRLKAHSSN
jgi:hypothetical protein